MVSRSVEKIKENLPGLLHLVMFYNDGIVFQTSFSSDYNIPKIGHNLAELLKLARNLIVMYNQNEKTYRKLIYETELYILFIVKLGEDSNLALFLDNQKQQEIKLTPIRKYLEKLEELIDMEKAELEGSK